MKAVPITVFVCLRFVFAFGRGDLESIAMKFDVTWSVTFVTEGFRVAGKTGSVRFQIVGRGSTQTKYRDFQVGWGPKTHRFTTRYIGEPTHINMRFLDRKNSWHLKQVELMRTDDMDNKYIFKCRCWVNDTRITTIYPYNPMWIITVFTGNNKTSYTDRLWIKITGTHDVSRNINTEDTDFRTGKKVTQVKSTKPIGIPAKIAVRHETFADDGKAMYYLDRIEFQRGDSPGTTKYVFHCDCEIREIDTKTIYLSNPRWRIWTHTGNITGFASTDAHVFIKLVGSAGKSIFVELENLNYDDFEFGAWDKFVITTTTIGDTKAIVMGMWEEDLWYFFEVQMELIGSFDNIMLFPFCGYLWRGWSLIERQY